MEWLWHLALAHLSYIRKNEFGLPQFVRIKGKDYLPETSINREISIADSRDNVVYNQL